MDVTTPAWWMQERSQEERSQEASLMVEALALQDWVEELSQEEEERLQEAFVAFDAAEASWQDYGRYVEMAPPPHGVRQMRMRIREVYAWMRMLAAASASPAPSLLAQGPLDTDASSSAPLAIVSVGMDSHPSEAAGYERQELAMHSPSSSSGTRNLHNLFPQEQQLVLAPPHFITRSSGGRGRNGGGPPDFIELSAQCLWREYLRSQQRPDYDLEAGGQEHRVGGGAAAPVQQPPEVVAVMVQALAALLPTCVKRMIASGTIPVKPPAVVFSARQEYIQRENQSDSGRVNLGWLGWRFASFLMATTAASTSEYLASCLSRKTVTSFRYGRCSRPK